MKKANYLIAVIIETNPALMEIFLTAFGFLKKLTI